MKKQTYNNVCEALGFTPRDEQFTLINAVQENLTLGEKSGHSLAAFESPTGTGKSLAYLLASCEFIADNPSASVTIVTATRQLQLQIKDEFDRISHLYPGRKLQILQGRANYLSGYRVNRLISLYEKGDDDRKEEILPLLKELLRIAEVTCGNMMVIDANYDILKKLEALGIDTDYLSCMATYSNGSQVKNKEHLRYYEMAKNLASKADIVVTNYQMLLASSFNFPPHLVLDEAHQMVDEAIRAWSESLALSTLAYTLKVMSKLRDVFSLSNRQKLQNASYSISQKIKAIMELSEQDARENIVLSGNNEDPSVKKLVEMAKDIYYIATEAANIVKRVKADTDEVDAFLERYEKLKSIYMTLTDQKLFKDVVCYLMTFSPVEKYPSLHKIYPLSAPKLSHVFTKKQYRNTPEGAKSIALISGTLRSIFAKEKPFEWIIAQGGLRRYSESCQYYPMLNRVFHGFDFRRKITVYFYENAPYYQYNEEVENPSLESIKEYVNGISEIVSDIVSKAKGKTLILTTSHQETVLLREKLREMTSLNIMSFVPFEKSITGTLQKVKQEFEDTPEKTVLITASAWQGFNITGEITDLVITRIPFGNPSDPLMIAQMHAMENMDTLTGKRTGKMLYRMRQLKTAIRLLQGIGRLARHENSRGNIHLIDRRLLDKTDPFAREIRNTLFDRYSYETVEKEEAYVVGV